MSDVFEAIVRNDVTKLSTLNSKSALRKEAIYDLKSKNCYELPTDNLTLLHIAAFYDSTECLAFLHNTCKFPHNAKSAGGFEPFHYACVGGSMECAALLALFYENDHEGGFQEFYQQDYSNGIHNLPFLATTATSKEILVFLFESGYDFEKYNAVNKIYVNKAIERSIRIKNTECLKTLLQYLNPSKKQEKITPLMMAVMCHQNAAIPLLLKAGCNPNERTIKNETALYFACIGNNIEAVNLLIDSMKEIDIPPEVKGKPAVHCACASHNLEIIELILSKDVNVNRADDEGNYANIHLRDIDDEEQVIAILDLLVQHGFDINHKSPRKGSVLELFVSDIKVKYNVIDWLLEHGANTREKMTSLKVGEKRKDIAHYILEKGIDKKFQEIIQKYPQCFA